MSANVNVVALPAAMTIDKVDKLVTDMSRVEVGDYALVHFDASKVEVITTPSIQVLVSFAKTIELLDGEMKIVNPSEGFKAAFGLLGFKQILEGWLIHE